MALLVAPSRRLLSAVLGTAVGLSGLVAAGDATPSASSLAANQSQAADVPEGADWYETYIESEDGTSLHVDVMRPAGMPDDVKTPVILVASPYIGTSEGTDTNKQRQPGPSDRFFDFFVGADVWGNGYTVVMVSLRGTGGSGGCLDILGPGEQMDIKAGVEWAASQAWSTGKVGMYGKSYDANTGAAALAVQPEGLEAVVAQAIAPDRYYSAYDDRVRRLTSLLYPSVTYGALGEAGFSIHNDPQYIANSASRGADCQVLLAEHYLEDPSTDFWRARDFVDGADGTAIPALITAGYLDAATNIGAGALQLFETLQGPKRLWVGWWDHVRGNDLVGDRTATGREGWFEEVMRFYDQYLKGIEPDVADPAVVAQNNLGEWRTEAQWPPADVTMTPLDILPGDYLDDGSNAGSRDGGASNGGVGSTSPTSGTQYGFGTWTFTEPLEEAAHLAGFPTATIDVAVTAPRTNLVVNVYDVDDAGKATMITRGTMLVDASGEHTTSLYPTDWIIEEHHRIGVLVSGANNDAWIHVPTNTTVTVNGGAVDLPFLPGPRVPNQPGDYAPRLESYLATASFDVPVDMDARTAD